MKKIMVVLMSLLLVFTMIPAVAFADMYGDNFYDGKGLKVGDLVDEGEYIVQMSNFGETELTIRAEVVINENETWREEKVLKAYGYEEIYSPKKAIVDQIIFDEENQVVEYKLHATTALVGTYPTPNTILCEDAQSLHLRSGNGKDLTIIGEFYRDYDHKTKLVDKDGNPYDFEYVIAGDDMSFLHLETPIPVYVDKVFFDEEKNIMKFTYRYAGFDIGYHVDSVIYEGSEVGAYTSNYFARDIIVEYQVYEDKACTKPISKSGYSLSETVASGGYSEKSFTAPENVRVAEIVDNAMENPAKVIYKMYSIKSAFTDEEKAFVKQFSEVAKAEFEKISSNKLHLKIANPELMGIDGYSRNDATMYVGDARWCKHEWGIVERIKSKEMGLAFDADGVISTALYKDKALTQKIEYQYDGSNDSVSPYYYPIEPNTTYYMDVYYSLYYSDTTTEVHVDKPIEVSFEYVNVSPNTKEVKQIKTNSKTNIIFELTDLARINALVVGGLDSFFPPLNNPDAFLKKQNEDTYKKIIGDSNLDVEITYGGGGDSFEVIGNSGGGIYYYADDVYYGSGSHKMYINQILYVPQGTTDRGTVAEKRIKDYLGEGSFEVEFDKVTDKANVEFYSNALNISDDTLKDNLGIDSLDQIKAIYFTEHGVAYYSHETSTDKQYYLGAFMVCLPTSYSPYGHDLFTNSQLEEVGTLAYMVDPDGNPVYNTTAYAPYKLTLTHKTTSDTQDYLYMVGIGTEEQLKEPLADWKDEETGIVTKGENGYIPFDAYTKIRVIKGGEEIKFIKNKVGDDKAVNCFDINAYTNFKGGKLEDLGDGLMKVMIPIGKIKEEGVKAHYVDDEGNVQDLEFTVEEVEGQKYVCFIVKHFSVYAISGDMDPVDKFEDLDKNFYYYQPVAWAVKNGITMGVDATHFAPDDACTRGQIVTFLWRAAGMPHVDGEIGFTDVKEDWYYTEAIKWAVKEGITAGTEPGKFSPDDPCTRGQVVTFLWRAAGKPQVDIETGFTDVDDNWFYAEAVKWAVKENITAGVDATHFAPDQSCTRGQIVTFLYRYMED